MAGQRTGDTTDLPRSVGAISDLGPRDHLRFERILEATGAGTWEYNVQTGEAVVDARWAEIVGYTLAELGENGRGA